MKKAFTLAEVLITLAIIGVVAALTIPSVISNSQQQEFRTGLRKAVSVLNSAITMNMAIDGETPYDNADTFKYLQRHMAVMKTTNSLPWYSYKAINDEAMTAIQANYAFYTTDGMRFEVQPRTLAVEKTRALRLHESDYTACNITGELYDADPDDGDKRTLCGGCGSLGLANNPNGTKKPPCAILVDVNGDRKPTPQYIPTNMAADYSDNKYQKYWIPDVRTKRIYDIFSILITEDRAIPYGVVAQKAMYQAQK